MKVIHVLRKPLSEGTVAKNVLKHGTGGLNIDKSRLSEGRWPANVILQHKPECANGCVEGCPVAALDEQSGVTQSCRSTVEHPAYEGESATGLLRGESNPWNQYDDSGGASRFFNQVGGQDDSV
jgi:hypothetical protein